MGSPFLSIIIPVYNVEKYLAQCLDSVFSQWTDDVEVIAVNDGSTDGSGLILKRYASLDWDLKIIEQSNKGLSCARNEGIAKARGRYLLFLDSDDLLSPSSLGSIKNLDWQEEYDFIEFDYKQFKDGLDLDQVLDQIPHRGAYGGKTVGPGQVLFVEWYENHFFWTSANSRVYSTDFILRNCLRFPEGVFFEDTLWTPKVFQLARRARYEPVLVYLRRLDRPGSIMEEFQKEINEQMIKDRLFISQSLYDLSIEDGNSLSFTRSVRAMASSVFLKECLKLWRSSDPSHWDLLADVLRSQWHLAQYSSTWKWRVLYRLISHSGIMNAKRLYDFARKVGLVK